MKERIKKLRKILDLTQQGLADKLGISRNNIATYETGKSLPGDATITLICKTFNVREEWLRNGVGEMFKPDNSQSIDMLANEYNLAPAEYALIRKFVKLKPENRKAVLDYILDFANSITEYNTETANPTNTTEQLDIDKEVEEYRRQLELQAKAMEKSSALRNIK